MINGHGDDAFRYADIRANFSSNIYAHADLSALKQHLCTRLDAIATYPEPEPLSLAAAIAQRIGVPAECILVANGATEAIYLIAQMASRHGYGRYFIGQPTFREYEDASEMYLMQPATAPDDDVVTWVCNPNNPTGSVTPAGQLPQEGLLVLDQSYEDYTDAHLTTPQEAIDSGRTLLLYSLTKTFAVPGLRIGYVVAAPRLIAQLRAFVRPWAVNALAIEAALWLLDHGQKAVADKKGYLAEAQRLRDALCRLDGLTVEPTRTNFMLCRLEHQTAAELKQYLAEEHHLLIRDASNFRGLDAHCFRVAAQLPEENDRLVGAISRFLNQD